MFIIFGNRFVPMTPAKIKMKIIKSKQPPLIISYQSFFSYVASPQCSEPKAVIGLFLLVSPYAVRTRQHYYVYHPTMCSMSFNFDHS